MFYACPIKRDPFATRMMNQLASVMSDPSEPMAVASIMVDPFHLTTLASKTTDPLAPTTYVDREATCERVASREKRKA
jgi:hypothetical protein